MSTIQVSLPDAMRTFVEEQSAREGHPSVSDYLQAMIQQAQDREARREVEAKLLDAIASGPATPMTREDWDDIRREVHQRHAERQGTKNGPTQGQGRQAPVRPA